MAYRHEGAIIYFNSIMLKSTFCSFLEMSSMKHLYVSLVHKQYLADSFLPLSGFEARSLA